MMMLTLTLASTLHNSIITFASSSWSACGCRLSRPAMACKPSLTQPSPALIGGQGERPGEGEHQGEGSKMNVCVGVEESRQGGTDSGLRSEASTQITHGESSIFHFQLGSRTLEGL